MSDRPDTLEYERRPSWTPDWWDRNWAVLFGVASNAGIFAVVGPIMVLIGTGALLVPSVVIPWYWGGVDATAGRWLVVFTWLLVSGLSIGFLTWGFRRWRLRMRSADARIADAQNAGR